MIASAPADVVVESIKAMKASGEQPSVEQLEQVSKAMLATLGNPEYDMPEPAGDMPTDDAEVGVPAGDMPTDAEVDVPAADVESTLDGLIMEDATSTTTEAPAIADDAEMQQDMPELDGMLKGLMDFEAKLFGEEDEGKLKAFVSGLQSDEAGHNEEVKDSIKQLEAYRATLTAGAGMPIPKEEADRMILLAEIFTSMIASAPADVVVESIKAMKASGEQPSVEQLEQMSQAMLATLGNPEYDMPEPAGDMPTDDAEVGVADDMPTDEPVDVADDMPTDEPVDVAD